MSANDQTPAAPVRVFISYSHDSPEHSDRVLALAQQLHRDGIDAELDQFHQNELVHWPRWCEEQLRPENSRWVICVCTPEYKRRVENRVPADVGKGVFWEATLIHTYLYDEKGNRRCVPVRLGDAGDDAVPQILKGWNGYKLTAFGLDARDSGYEGLYRLLTGQSTVVPEPVGPGRTSEITEPIGPALDIPERMTDFTQIIADLRRAQEEHETQSVRRHGTLKRGLAGLALLLVLVITAIICSWVSTQRVVTDPKILRVKLEEKIEQTFQEKRHQLLAQKAKPADIDQLFRWRDDAIKRLDDSVRFIQSTVQELQSPITKKAAAILQERGVDAALEYLDTVLAAEGKSLKERARELAEASLFKAELHNARIEFDAAERAIKDAIALAYDWWEPHNSLGILFFDRAQWDAAEADFQEAQKFVKTDEELAVVLNNLAALSQATNRLAEAEPMMRRALAIDEKSYGPEHPKVARDLNNLAQLLQDTNRLAEAEPMMRRALAINEKTFGSEHPEVAIDLSNLAQLLKATNRLAEAEPLMQRALATAQKSFGSEHPEVAIDLNNLALLLQATNRLAEAEPLMRRALAIDEKSFGSEHPNVAMDLNNLAQLLQDTNRLPEAEPLMRRALAIDEKSFGSEHPKVARDLNNLALLLKDTNRLAEAEPLMRRALAIDEKSFGTEHPNVAIDLNNLAQLLQDTNRLPEAEPLMRRALAIDEKSFGPEHPEIAIRLNNLALLLQATNQLAEAEPLMRRALTIFLKFTRATGHLHPGLRTVFGNFRALLAGMSLGEKEISKRIAELGPEAGFDPDAYRKVLEQVLAGSAK
jgi:tetratricopeptide (TPR) repeat protein